MVTFVDFAGGRSFFWSDSLHIHPGVYTFSGEGEKGRWIIYRWELTTRPLMLLRKTGTASIT